MKFFKAKYVGKRRFDAAWDTALEAFRQHLNTIFPALPESVQAFERHTNRFPLHDAGVESISRNESRELHIELDDRRLEFLAVRESSFPEPLLDGTVWLYEELDRTNGGFELRALFDKGELRVVAKEIRVFDKRLKRYVIPADLPPEPSRLFLDRKPGRKP